MTAVEGAILPLTEEIAVKSSFALATGQNLVEDEQHERGVPVEKANEIDVWADEIRSTFYKVRSACRRDLDFDDKAAEAPLGREVTDLDL